MVSNGGFDPQISTRRISLENAFPPIDKRPMASSACSKGVTKSFGEDNSCQNIQSRCWSADDPLFPGT